MFTRILRAFTAPQPDPLPEPDARLALGALLVRVAKSDNVYRFEEISQIDRLLARLNTLNPVEAAKLRALCERLEAEAPDTARFTAVIRDNVDTRQRLEALEALWHVVLIDGSGTAAELAIVEDARIAFDLDEASSSALRQKVEARQPSNNAPLPQAQPG